MSKTVTPKYPRYFNRRSSRILNSLVYLLFLLIIIPLNTIGQDNTGYEEISVFLNISKVGGADIPAVMVDEAVYLPVAEIFNLLKVKNTPSAQLDSISGFFINQAATYLIDKTHNRITFQDKVYDLKSKDMVKTESALYLKSNYFGQIFGLDCVFNFRSLSVTLTTKLELPIIREMRQAEMRGNINRLKGEVKTDTVIGRKYPAFHFGMADWAVNNSQLLGGKTDTRVNLDLGTVIAGGEANIRLNYNNNTPFEEKQQQYLWRFVNNEQPLLRQVMAGKIYSQMTSSIFNPIIGVQFTNTPTTYRRSYGTYTLKNFTEPNWVVELYVNNVLVDYMKADASGFYKFEVPMVYGNSTVTLKFYGPWGEERINEQNISIPFNFLPPHELEYTLSAGVVEDTLSSRFSRATLNYGLSRRITIGGGVEYLSSVMTGNAMPFINTSLRLFSGLLLTGEYTYGVRSKGMLSYRLPSNLQFELNYIKYHPGQKAIIYNYLEERKATVSIPIRGKDFAAYSRFTVNQILLPGHKNTYGEMLWSGSIYGVSTNFTNYALFNDFTKPYLYSNLSLAFRMPYRMVITPQAQYDYNNKKLISVKTNLEKPLFKRGYLNMSYEQNFRSHTSSIEFGFRYDLTFAQTGFSMRNTNHENTLIETARGSLLYDAKTHYVGTNNRTSVGKGAVTILPFLDVNGNGIYEHNEPKVTGLHFRINGGSIVQNNKDTTIRILDLVPYTSYLLELDKNSFDNIAWQMHQTTIKVVIDPNQFKTIEVPIAVMGEASGTVYKGTNGQGRILMCFYRSDSTMVARTLTEADGYYSYLGLKPGKYTVKIDPAQLKKINMVSSPEKREVTFSNSVDGDIKDGLDFKLMQIGDIKADTSLSTSMVETSDVSNLSGEEEDDEPISNDGNALLTVHDSSLEINQANQPKHTTNDSIFEKLIIKEPVIIDYKGKSLEAGSFKFKSNAFALRDKIARLSTNPVIIIYGDFYYSVRILGFASQEVAMPVQIKVTEAGFETPYISHGKLNTSSVQLGEFSQEQKALDFKDRMVRQINRKVFVVYENSMYKVYLPGFLSHQAAVDFITEMNK